MQNTLLRLPSISTAIGLKRSAIYDRIKRGLMPAPIALGQRAVGWPQCEIEAIVKALISGASEDDIRALVAEMHQARGHKPDLAKAADYANRVAKRRTARKA